MTNSSSDENGDRDDDRGNASTSTGASGSGSFGNQQGAPVTGGTPDNGTRGEGDVHPREHANRGGEREHTDPGHDAKGTKP